MEITKEGMKVLVRNDAGWKAMERQLVTARLKLLQLKNRQTSVLLISVAVGFIIGYIIGTTQVVIRWHFG